MNENDKNSTKGTITVKKRVDIPQSHGSFGKNRVVEVEIKTKKSSGLRINLKESNTTKLQENKSKEQQETFGLTEEEVKRRVAVLQSTIHVQESQKEQEDTHATIEHIENNDVEKPDASIQHTEPNADVVSNKREYKKQQKKRENVKVEKKQPIVFKASEYTKQTQTPVREHNNIETVKQNTKRSSQRDKEKRNIKTSTEPDKQKNKTRVDTSKSSRYGDKKGKKISRAALGRVLDDDSLERTRSDASFKRARQKLRNVEQKKEAQKVVREVEIPDMIVVSDLANRMAVRSAEVIKLLMKLGIMVTVNQYIDGDTAEIICGEFGHKAKRISDMDIETEIDNYVDDVADLTERPPVVAVMGHVDHGKTTLLDTLRKTSVAARESGGITQHVSSYQIVIDGKRITFIDTPGHAAFSKIRERGAKITDIIVLVVSAEDGVKAQTIEAITDAKSQNVPLIVAINKIDKPNTNIERIKSELLGYGVVLEEYSGDVLSAEISALTGQNLDKLLDAIFLQAEIMQLTANKNRPASCVILETQLVKGRGLVGSAIVQNGTLSVGDVFVAGASFGKVRALYNDAGVAVTHAIPAEPVNIVGFDSSPEPGDTLVVVDSEQKAREIAENRKRRQKEKLFADSSARMSKLMDSVKEKRFLKLFVKGDVAGSVEALVLTLSSITHDEVGIVVTGTGIGDVNESDVEFAHQTGSLVIGFNINVSPAAKSYAKIHNVQIFSDDIIYRVVDEVKRRLGKLLTPITEEVYIGACEVRKIFHISRVGTIAGCYVTDGIIRRNNTKIYVERNGNNVYSGKITSMKHEKDEIKESKQTHECGILTEGFNDYKEGDIIKCYEIVQKERFIS